MAKLTPMPDKSPMSETAQHALNDQLDEWLSDADRMTREWVRLWQDGLDYVFDNQLVAQRREKGWERVQANYIYPALQTMLGMMVERAPQIIARPRGDADPDGAMFWQRLLQFQYDTILDMPMTVLRAALDGMVYGYYVGKVFWEPHWRWLASEQRWQGAPRVQLVHPARFGTGEAERLEDAPYVYCRRRVPVAEAQTLWPKHKDRIASIAEGGAAEYDEPWLELGGSFIAYDDQKDTGPSMGTEGLISNLLGWRQDSRSRHKSPLDGTDRARYINVEEIYWRDYTTYQDVKTRPLDRAKLMASGQIIMGEDGVPRYRSGEPATADNWPHEVDSERDIPSYPYGRYVVRVGHKGNRLIFNQSEASQMWPYTEWPYVIGLNSILPHVWQGLNSVAMGKGMQDYVNTTMAQMVNYVRYFSQPPLIVETDTVQGATANDGVAKKLLRTPGAIWKVLKNRKSGIEIPQMPQMPPSLVTFYELAGKELRDQVGIQNQALGREGQPKTATEARDLLRSTYRRTGVQLFLQDRWILKIMEYVSELDHAHMQPGDPVRLARAESAKLLSRRAMGTVYRVLHTLAIEGTDLVMEMLTAQNEEARTATNMPEEHLDVQYDLALEVGTQVPFDITQQAKKEDLSDLFTLLVGAVPTAALELLPRVLRAYQMEDADDLAARIQEAMQSQQDAQQEDATLAQQQQAMQARQEPQAASREGP